MSIYMARIAKIWNYSPVNRIENRNRATPKRRIWR